MASPKTRMARAADSLYEAVREAAARKEMISASFLPVGLNAIHLPS